MFRNARLSSRSVHVLHLIALAVLAAMLSLLFATQTRGFEGWPSSEGAPALLPSEMVLAAVPLKMPAEPDEMLTPPEVDPLEGMLLEPPRVGLETQLDNALSAHRRGDVERALELWAEIEMPADSVIWQQLAKGSAYLATNNLQLAQIELEMAMSNDPYNPLAHYYTGILRMEQARCVLPDNVAGMGNELRRVSFRPYTHDDRQAVYRAAAIMEFETALQLADALKLSRPLVQPYDMTDPMYQVTVGDLLVAIGADKYVGKSHLALGSLYLEQGDLKRSEEHFDRATQFGIDAGDGYLDLAEVFEEEALFAEAARANLKSLQHGSDLARPLTSAWSNFKSSITQR